LWAARLGLYLLWRWRKHGADRRYVAIFAHYEKTKRWNFATTSLIIVFGLQAVLSYLVALPVQLGQGPGALGALAYAGAALTIVGVLFETIG
ncbi:DUF1295 domain-containing protein, partial [Klebsiella pneumoniae]|uniref:DUF1295 domain-containing protein n=1 Tax=Klebsiella pneumoniae TaxID=573 RepID=UPI002730E62D